mmetsp:Transcript_16679/g.31313  ORF Transcript_16679/g.31313 Transcript_16679/m.31313 type:complete len:278 (+) Transcript_16679:695-1528(+)
MGVVHRRQRDGFAGDVEPYVEFRPVADREAAEVLARPDAGVEQRPQFGPLLLGLPLAEAVAVTEDALLGARLLLVAAGAANQRIEPVFLDGLQQRHGLVAVAAFQRVGEADGAAGDAVFQMPDHQALAHLGHALVTEADDLGEVVARVDVHQREGQVARVAARVRGVLHLERLLGQAQHDAGVLAAGEQQGGALEACSDLAQDEDGLFFQRIQVRVVDVGDEVFGFHSSIHDFACRPHSFVESSHHHRPARKSSPTAMARVQGAQPIEGMNWSCSGL